MPEAIQERAIYTVAQAARLVQCDRRVIRAAIDAGELRSFVPNGCTKGLRVLGAWLIGWTEKRAAIGKEGYGEVRDAVAG